MENNEEADLQEIRRPKKFIDFAKDVKLLFQNRGIVFLTNL
jgi:hypothetical protein